MGTHLAFKLPIEALQLLLGLVHVAHDPRQLRGVRLPRGFHLCSMRRHDACQLYCLPGEQLLSIRASTAEHSSTERVLALCICMHACMPENPHRSKGM